MCICLYWTWCSSREKKTVNCINQTKMETGNKEKKLLSLYTFIGPDSHTNRKHCRFFQRTCWTNEERSTEKHLNVAHSACRRSRFYLDDLAWHKGQLLCSRLVVWRHCSRVVWVKCDKEPDGGYGHLARSFKLPIPEIFWSSNPYFIWVYQNIQLEPRLHLQQSEHSTVHLADRWPLWTAVLSLPST